MRIKCTLPELRRLHALLTQSVQAGQTLDRPLRDRVARALREVQPPAPRRSPPHRAQVAGGNGTWF